MSIKTFASSYKMLNAEQKKAVDTIEGPVMVIAGPGTGKTQILTLRIANILRTTDTPPDGIIALTFTESGAFAMRRRLVDIVGAPGYRVRIYTFHGFANDVIGRFPDSFPRIVGARSMIDVERIELMQGLISNTPLEYLRPYGDPFFYVRSVLGKIGELKRENISPDKFEEVLYIRSDAFKNIPDLFHEKGVHKGAMRGKYAQTSKRLVRSAEMLTLYRLYEVALTKQRLYDYEDMLLEVIRALEADKELLLTLQEESQYILADEHQDANESQNRLLELLASFYKNPNLFVVGDEKQAIFRFQGASLDNFLYFKKQYPEAVIITLRENYRSTQPILDSAHQLMTHAPVHAEIPRIPLISSISTPSYAGKIKIVSLPRPDDERAFVAEDIARLVAEGVPLRDIAVLYRVNGDAQGVAGALARRNIPFVVESSQNILEDLGVRKFLVLLRAVALYGSDQALAPALHIDFLELSPLEVTRFIARARGDLYNALGDKKKLVAMGVKKPLPFVGFAKKLERWKRITENDGLLAVLDSVAEESGLIASLLRAHNPEEKFASVSALFTEARQVRTTNRNASLQDFLTHIALLEEYRLSLSLPRASSTRDAVRLMTAHKSKGLEFEYVYIIHANDGRWGNRTSKEFFSPIRMAPNNDNADDGSDERRLFYVALTRAKLSVTITLARESESGAPALPSQFVEEIGNDLVDKEERTETAPVFNPGRTPQRHALDIALVQELFAEQGLSVTALNNYLACPWRYFYRNLIRMPEVPEKSLEYGTAVHRALKEFFEQWKEGVDVGSVGLAERFKRALDDSSLNESDYADSLKKGEKALVTYYNQWHTHWRHNILNEYKVTTFLPVGIEGLARIRLRGDFDKVEFTEDGFLTLYDYKTGRKKSRGVILGKDGVENWGDYRRQLVFYKLLLGLFEKGKWKMRTGSIDFVEPDDKGNTVRETFEISDEEVSELTCLVQRIASEIWQFSFTKNGCNKKDCKYCTFRDLAR